MEGLPAGVTRADWSLERLRWQNPRLRCLLGCYQVLDRVFESNYAILHCSPQRLRRVCVQVRRVASTLNEELGRLLRTPSCVPKLEQARRTALLDLCVLEQGALTDVLQLPDLAPESDEEPVRKILCGAIGRMHCYVLDALGRLLAADPRSEHDPDYFLTRKFARDVEEAEWLVTSVARLETFLMGPAGEHAHQLDRMSRRLAETRGLPSPDEWKPVTESLTKLVEGLTPQLKALLGMRGIRFAEIDLLEEHVSEIPARCRALPESFTMATELLAQIAADRPPTGDATSVDLGRAHEAAARALETQLGALLELLCDLQTFVPLWRQSIETRRALILRA